MTKFQIYVLLLIIVFGHRNGYTQQVRDPLEYYLTLAAENNPDLKAAFNTYLAALEKVPQVGALPNPEATFGFFLRPMELLGGNQYADVRLMQMFPWFGTIKTAKDEASKMALSKFEAFRTLKAEIFFKVSESWFQMIKTDQKIIQATENLELLVSMEKRAMLAFQSNLTDMTDVLRVKMQILDEKNRIAQLKDQLATEQSNFNAMLDRDQSLIINLPDTLMIEILPIDIQSLKDSILNNNPMLAMLNAEAESLLSLQEKVRLLGFPMMGLGLDYMLIGTRSGNLSEMNGKDMLMPMVSLSIPLNRKKYSAMRNEAQYLREATLQKLQGLGNHLLVEYERFVKEFSDAKRRIDLSKEQSELAENTLHLLLTRYSNSGTGYDEILQTQASLLNYRLNEIEAIADYNIAIAKASNLMNSVDK